MCIDRDFVELVSSGQWTVKFTIYTFDSRRVFGRVKSYIYCKTEQSVSSSINTVYALGVLCKKEVATFTAESK